MVHNLLKQKALMSPYCCIFIANFFVTEDLRLQQMNIKSSEIFGIGKKVKYFDMTPESRKCAVRGVLLRRPLLDNGSLTCFSASYYNMFWLYYKYTYPVLFILFVLFKYFVNALKISVFTFSCSLLRQLDSKYFNNIQQNPILTSSLWCPRFSRFSIFPEQL